jgi:aromatic-L-amino-acid/L-tryptophan decarboxylase
MEDSPAPTTSLPSLNFQMGLEPSVEEWQELVGVIQEFLTGQLKNLEGAPILHQEPAPPLSESTVDLQAYLEQLFKSGFNAAHPGFLAYIPGGGLLTSALADWLIKTTNRYGTAHFASPNLADLEYKVIQTFCDWVGYPDRAAGVLTTGGSLANFTAVVTARRARLPENFLDGVLYCSEQTHHSVMKAANLAGFSSRNLRLLPADEQFRLEPAALEKQILEDRSAGLSPFLVIASAGTTNTGAIDPIPAIADICEKHKLWLHIDAAYGGSFVLTSRGRERLQGMHRADSITLDPHKGMFLPYGTGSILVRDRDALIEAHEMRGEYMPDLDHSRAHLDPFSLSVELSREHRGLKIWLPLMIHGREAFEQALDEKLDLTEYVYEELSKLPQLEILNQPELTTVVFRLPGDGESADKKNQALLDAINAQQQVFLSGTSLNGQYALRVSILSHRTHRKQIDGLLSSLGNALRSIG